MKLYSLFHFAHLLIFSHVEFLFFCWHGSANKRFSSMGVPFPDFYLRKQILAWRSVLWLKPKKYSPDAIIKLRSISSIQYSRNYCMSSTENSENMLSIQHSCKTVPSNIVFSSRNLGEGNRLWRQKDKKRTLLTNESDYRASLPALRAR